ncbi:MAG TPA: DNA polymerase III subunit gamma and tau [Pseudonocardiaceae bacterium]|nr:DNA polymerase III subunit gamma and tau [Pseudonocardiaceae bacterium]
MALALYRKYRPATFAEVVGQEHVTEPLRIALSAKRINHAYLFSGPRGCGKTSSARILARSLNCVNGPTPDPCGVCNSCVGLAPEGPGSVDVVELDAASHGGVDDARELRDKAFYAPAESRYRVFIIDEAHMVTTQGFNALLKIVEEPPEHLVFIFATTEPDKVLATIRSRTHHYPFRLIPPGAMRALLERNCEAEGVQVEPAVYPLVIRAGGGSARDTQSVLDQLLAGAGPGGVTYDRAVALLGVTDVGLIDDIVDGFAAGDGPAVFGTVDRLVEAGHDPRRFATDLLERLRDLVLLCAVPDAADRGLVNAPEDELSRMRAQADRLGPATLTRYAEILHAGLIEMRGATAPRLLVELLCARMLLPAAAATDAAVLQRLEGLERRVTLAPGSPAPTPAAVSAGEPPQSTSDGQRPAFQRPSRQPAGAPAPTPAPEPVALPQVTVPTPQPAAQEPAAPEPATPEPAAAQSVPAEPAVAVAPGAVDSTAVRQIWPELVSQVGQRSKPTFALLQNATVKAVEGNTLVLAMPTPGLARQLGQESRADVIRGVLHDLLSGDWQVRCVHGDGGAPPDGPGAARRPAARPARPTAEAPTRPSQSQRPTEITPPPAPRVAAREADVPPPPEPPDEDEPPPDPIESDGPPMRRASIAPPAAVTPLAEPVGGAAPAASTELPLDAVKIDLLTKQLGARRLG